MFERIEPAPGCPYCEATGRRLRVTGLSVQSLACVCGDTGFRALTLRVSEAGTSLVVPEQLVELFERFEADEGAGVALEWQASPSELLTVVGSALHQVMTLEMEPVLPGGWAGLAYSSPLATLSPSSAVGLPSLGTFRVMLNVERAIGVVIPAWWGPVRPVIAVRARAVRA